MLLRSFSNVHPVYNLIYQKPVFLIKLAPNLDTESDLNRFIKTKKIQISRSTEWSFRKKLTVNLFIVKFLTYTLIFFKNKKILLLIIKCMHITKCNAA